MTYEWRTLCIKNVKTFHTQQNVHYNELRKQVKNTVLLIRIA